MVINQYEIYWVNLDPSFGHEVKKTRPCTVISPNEMNYFIETIIIAPLTSTIKAYPSRVLCKVNGKKGCIMLDQIRTVDKKRLVSKIEQLSSKEIVQIKRVLKQMLVD